MRSHVFVTGLALLASAGAATAHPKLVSATPTPNSAVAAPGRVELHFSERLMPKFSGADLLIAPTGHAPTKVASAAMVASDGRTLVVSPRTRLEAGRYRVAWHAVSVDTHHVAGSYAFSVK